MKKIKIILLALLASLYTNASAQCTFDDDKVIVVSHRGDWRFAAENSLEAFNSSVGVGVNMVELDITKTKDGKLILLHDKTLDRTTTGKGKPSDYTLDEIKSLYLRNGCGVPTSQKVPTLEEVMTALKGKIWVNIDKGYDYFDDVAQILKKTGTTQQVIIKAGVPYQQIAQEHPGVLSDLVFMPIINCKDEQAIEHIDEYLKKAHPVAFEVVFSTLTPKVYDVIRHIKEGGSKVWINSLWPSLSAGMNDDRAVFNHQEEETWGKIIEMGASFIQTDRPQELIDYLKTKELYQSNQNAASIREKLVNKNHSYGFVVSHRGDWLRYPENSIAAIKSSFAHGTDIVEIDVQKTRDGVLVLSHDETLDRCTDGTGRIDALKYKAIKTLHLKDKDGRITAYTMPTLEEALLACKGKVMVNIDKGDRFIEEIMQVLQKTGTENIAILKSYKTPTEVKASYGKYLDKILYMPAINLDTPNALETLETFDKELAPFAYELNYKKNETLAIKAHDLIKNHSLLWFNSLNGRNFGHDDFRSLSCPEDGFGYIIKNYHANIIQTDFPEGLVKYYKKEGLR